jgi:hypothetical protein
MLARTSFTFVNRLQSNGFRIASLSSLKVAHPMDKIDINSIEHAGEFFHQLKYIGRGVGYFLVIFVLQFVGYF